MLKTIVSIILLWWKIIVWILQYVEKNEIEQIRVFDEFYDDVVNNRI